VWIVLLEICSFLVFWSWSPWWSIKEEEIHVLQILWTHILGGDSTELLCEKHKTIMWWLIHLASFAIVVAVSNNHLNFFPDQLY
jgi:hypothetical protein